MGEHQIKVDCTAEYWQRTQQARAAGMVTNPSGLAKVAISHAMEHGQPATEALLRANGNGAQDVDHQLEHIEELLTGHHREHELGQDENRGCIEVWLKVLAAFAFVSVILSATAVYLVARQAATA